MGEQNHTNCWDFWNCPTKIKTNCPAYINNAGQHCWLAAGKDAFEHTPKCEQRKKRFKNCDECPWFKKLNPDLY